MISRARPPIWTCSRRFHAADPPVEETRSTFIKWFELQILHSRGARGARELALLAGIPASRSFEKETRQWDHGQVLGTNHLQVVEGGLDAQMDRSRLSAAWLRSFLPKTLARLGKKHCCALESWALGRTATSGSSISMASWLFLGLG